MVSRFAPGPWMVRFVPIVSAPLPELKVMVCPLRELAKSMVSPEIALFTQERSEPESLGLSELSVTVQVCACALLAANKPRRV